MRRTLVAGLASITVLAACPHGHGNAGEPSGATCAPGSTLTYQSFMTTYCVGCHDSQKVGEDRMGAPPFHDFDTVEGVRVVADHIDEYAAAGPAATNEIMPPEGSAGPFPSLAERQMLGEWLACGAP